MLSYFIYLLTDKWNAFRAVRWKLSYSITVNDELKDLGKILFAEQLNI